MTVPEKHIYKLKFVTLLYTDTHPEFEYTHGSISLSQHWSVNVSLLQTGFWDS